MRPSCHKLSRGDFDGIWFGSASVTLMLVSRKFAWSDEEWHWRSGQVVGFDGGNMPLGDDISGPITESKIIIKHDFVFNVVLHPVSRERRASLAV